MAVLASDTWNRTVSNGWGTASDGVSVWSLLSGTASSFSVAPSNGKVTYVGAAQYMQLGTATQADVHALTEFTPSATGDFFGILFRMTDYHNHYRARFAAGVLRLEVDVSNTPTILSSTSFTITAGQAYWMRVQMVGASMAVKLWAASGGEPTAWTIQATDTTYTTGTFGLYLDAVTSGDTILTASTTVWSVTAAVGVAAEGVATASATATAVYHPVCLPAVGRSTQPGPFRTRPLTHYYVNPATGSDSNAGTSSLAPWATLAHGATYLNGLAGGAAAGAWVHAAPGVYHEVQIYLTAQGTPQAHIVFVSDVPGAAQIITSDLLAAFFCSSTGQNAASGLGNIEIVGFDVTDVAPHACAVGIKIGAPNTLVYGCRIHDLGSSLAANSGGGGIDTDNYGDGLSSMGDEIVANTVLRCGPTAGGNQYHGIYISNYGAVVAANLVVDIPGGYAVHGYHACTQAVITNNTLVNPTGIGAIVVGGNLVASIYNRITNNICSGGTAYSIRSYADGGGSVDYTLCVDNVLYGAVAGPTDFQGAHDSNTGAITSDPLFVTYQPDGTGDYSLQATSPAIAAGLLTAVGAPGADVRGASLPAAPRTVGGPQAYDLGAFGYQPLGLVGVLVVVAGSGGQSGGSGGAGSGGGVAPPPPQTTPPPLAQPAPGAPGVIVVVGPVLTPAFVAALSAASAVWNAGVDLLAADEVTPLEVGGVYDLTAADRLLPGSASVALDVTMTTLRTLTLSLRTSDGRYLPGAAGAPSGGAGSPLATGLTWLNVRYRPWLDLLTGYDAVTGAPQWRRSYLGVYVLTQPQITLVPQQAVAQLTLGDKSVLLQKPYLLTASNLPQYTATGGHAASGYAQGSTFDAAMRDMATRGGVPAGRLHFEPSTLTLPDDYAVIEGDEPWVHLQTLAAAMPHVCYFDALGNLVRRQNPLAVNTPSVWTFAPGPLATVSQVQRTTDFTSTYNHIIVLGGSSSTQLWRGEAQLQDASNPYHANEIGDRITFWGQNGLGDLTPDPTIGSTAAAQAKAALLLAQHLGQQEAIQIQGRTLPQLAPYDRITAQLAGAGLNTDAQVTQATITLDTTGQMTLTGAKWIAVGS